MTIMDRNNIETQHDLEGLPRHLELTATSKTYQMRVSDTVLIVTASTGSTGDGIVTLPSLAEAVGKSYYVCVTFSGSNDLSLYEKETGSELTTYGALGTTDDHVMLFSDGSQWRAVINGIT